MAEIFQGPQALCFDLNLLSSSALRLLPDTRIAFANRHYCVTFREGEEIAADSPLLDFVPSPSHNRILNTISAMAPKAPSATIEFPITDRRGRNRWTHWSLKGRFDADGALLDLIAIGRIISEELRYRNALEDLMRISNNSGKSYEERARMILSVGVKYFDAEYAGITRLEGDLANPMVLNFELDHLREKQPFPRERSYIDLVLRAGPVVAIHDMRETDFIKYPFYSHLPLQSVMASEIYIGNRFYGIINFATLTPRSEAFSEKQIQFCRLIAQWLGYTLEQIEIYVGLQKSANRYRHFYERAPIMMAVVGCDGKLLDVNQTWLDRLGYDAASVIGRDLADFLTPQSRATARLEPCDDEPQPITMRAQDFVTRSGAVLSTQLASLGVAAEDLPILCVWVDVTERDRLREEMNATNRAISRANEDLKRFNTVAAHDLQEPLRKIRLYGDQLGKHLPGSQDDDAHHALNVVTQAAERLSRLVRDLLAFSRESERGYAHNLLDLKPLLSEVIGDLGLLIEESGAQITVRDMPRLTGDAVPLQRLFYNLILNALKYHRQGEAPVVEVFSRQTVDGATEIVVRDNGVGLPEGMEEEIFEPFVRLHTIQTAGSGIGLALVRSIAEGHGWSIRARRREPGGTDFIIRTDKSKTSGS
ncbi:ATP-binding protein [Breoghania sp. JC706]|uniref:PAS domain-containing sensor histidine kinase n=1 Tax=Breoghania sp. JC706 TaxID=3117732 RepID=UPI00300B9C1F